MMDSLTVETSQSSTDYGMGAAPKTFRIKRVGARPLSFTGSELGMAMSYTPAAPYWYEINIYRTTDQKFVLVVKLFFQSADEDDTAQAWACDSIGEVFDRIEGYDAANDVRVTVDIDDPHLSVPEMAAWAMDLRARAQAARRQYAGLVGQLLYDLESGS